MTITCSYLNSFYLFSINAFQSVGTKNNNEPTLLPSHNIKHIIAACDLSNVRNLQNAVA